MLVFPNIAPPHYITEDWEDVGIMSPMEDGSVISRARFTRSRGTWTIGWNCLSQADYAILMNFYRNQCKGVSEKFEWIHPITKQVYVVRMIGKEPFERLGVVGWTGEITLMEA